MQRIIQINIAGRIIPIEEDAYIVLKDYLNALESSFAGEDGREEIIQDIENRIAELFTIRLQTGSPAIDRSDVQKVIDTLGPASELHGNASGNTNNANTGNSYQRGNTYSGYSSQQQNYQRNQPPPFNYTHDRLLRNPYDKMIGGVCSGIAHYFGIDPMIIRLLAVISFLTFGVGFVAYIIAWIVIPAARTREELYNTNGGNPVTFHDITRNVGEELTDLKRRGEAMSRELRDFFSKKK